MSDFWVSPFEKPKKAHIKLAPVQVEAIHTRSSVRRMALHSLCETAEKSFPQVMLGDDALERLHDEGSVSQAAPTHSSHESSATQPENETLVASGPAHEMPAKHVAGAEVPETSVLDIEAIRQAVKNAVGKRAA